MASCGHPGLLAQTAIGWFKLNSDGASYGNPGKAGGGGIIRDCNGLWIKGFARSKIGRAHF